MRAAVSKPDPLPREDRDHVTADEVAAYLRDHPNFLHSHPELLAVLTPPQHHNGRDVVDMQNYMIERLQGKVGRLDGDRADLVALYRRSESARARVHEAILDVLNARSFEQFIAAITSDLAIKLDIDVVRLAVENENASGAHTRAGVRLLPAGTVDRLLGDNRQSLLRPSVAAEPEIYGAAAALVKSDVLTRLTISPMAPTGLLALGSREIGRFAPNRDGELLGFLAKVLESTARAWLDLPG